MEAVPDLLCCFPTDKELSPPLFEFRQAEPNRPAHHSETGNLLSLNVSIHQRGTDAKKPRGGLDIHRHFETLEILLVIRTFNTRTSMNGFHALPFGLPA
jgi:hypothetical protein